MKRLFMIFTILFISSCGKYNEVYLYDEHDEDYDAVLQLGQQECIDKNKIFEKLDQTSDFQNYGYQVGSIYKLIEEVKDKDKTIRYAKILSISDGKMHIALRSPNSNEDKVIIFTQEDNKKIIGTVAIGVCSNENYYQHGSLNRTDLLSYSYKRSKVYSGTSQNPINFLNREDSFQLHTDYPLVLHLYNGTRVDEKQVDGSTYNISTNYTIQAITPNDCAQDKICDFDITPSKECTPIIDNQHYLTTDVDVSLIDLNSNCN